MAAVLLAMILLPASAGAAEEAASSGDLYAITEKGVGPFEDAGPNGAEKDVIEWVGETCSTKLLHVGLYLPPGTAEKRVEIASDTSDSCNLSSGEIEARREAAPTATTDAEPPAATTDAEPPAATTDEPLGGALSTDLEASVDSGETLTTSSTSTECGEAANYVHTSHTIQRGPFMEDIAWLRTTHHRAWNCASGWWKRLQTARAGGHRSVDFSGPPVWKEHNRSCSPDSASASCSTAVDVRLVATSCLPDEKYRIYTKVTTRSDGSQFVDTYRHGFCAGQSSSTGSKVNSSANDDYGGRSDDLHASPNPVTPPDESQVVKPQPEPDPPAPTPVLTAEGDWNFQPSGVWNGKKIYISPAAHDFGGRADNEGCNGYKESAGARSISMEAAGILAKRGFHLRVGTKDRSTNVDNSNGWGADAHIPLHSNAGASNCNAPYDYTKGGSMVLHNGVRTALAARILESLDPESPGSQKILCRGDVVGCSANAPLGEVIRPTGEVAYVEIAFHTFGPDEQWLRGVAPGRARPAEALARGVSEYYFPAPSIQPAAQIADSSGTGRWTVNVGQDGNRQTTLKMEYGDGTYETASIPQGSGTSTFSFSHTFKGGSTFGAATGGAPATEAEPSGTSSDVSTPNGTGTYAQEAVLDTGASAVAVTESTPGGSISISDADASTENQTALLFVSLAKASALPVAVDFTTADGTATAGDDYAPASGRLTFLPGETRKSVTVQINHDYDYEPVESFSVRLSAPMNAVIVDGDGMVTIANDDNLSSVSDDEYAVEGDYAWFSISLNNPTVAEARVSYSTANGTGIAGSDYVAQSGTVVFAPGEQEKSVSVPIIDDTATESYEDFFINLSSPVNADLVDPSGRATIPCNDSGCTGGGGGAGGSGSRADGCAGGPVYAEASYQDASGAVVLSESDPEPQEPASLSEANTTMSTTSIGDLLGLQCYYYYF